MSTGGVATAYAHCASVTRRSGSTFATTFWMCRRHQRRALYAIYAFCRLADDIADDPGVRRDRRALLERWRVELDAAYAGTAAHPVGVALADAAARFHLPRRLFLDLLAGLAADLDGVAIQSFEDLRRYCYCVASTVGMLVVHVLGFQNPRSLDYAEALGIAVQLTNILRDLGEDASSGRIYIPAEDLHRFGIAPASLRERRMTEELRLLLACYAERARLFYERADRLLPAEDRMRLRPAQAMGRLYRTLLSELYEQRFPCFGPPLRLSYTRRLVVAASTWLTTAASP